MHKLKINNCKLSTDYGDFEFYCFNWGEHEDQNILVLLKEWQKNTLPTIRIQSACFTGEIFKSHDCDCHFQLSESLQKINRKGGIFIYLLKDGRGAGIFPKTKALFMFQNEGKDTADAYDTMQLERDPRLYENVSEILNYFKVNSCTLLTNNPRKIRFVESIGIKVIHKGLEMQPTKTNFQYLHSKKEKLGHLLRNV